MTESKSRFQREKVFDLLSSPNPEGLTRLQIARCLGIERGSICYRVAELRDQGRLWVVKKGLCPITHAKAEFLTTNPEVAERAHAEQARRKERDEKTGRLF